MLPENLRPATKATHAVTGARVLEDRMPVPNAQSATFDLMIDTNGEVRYVDNAKVDDPGYVDFRVMQLVWQSNEARERTFPFETEETSGFDTDPNR